jgi:hypothetical protein
LSKKKIISDLILIICLLLVALGAFFILRAARETGEYAVVYVGNEEVARYSLSQDGEYTLGDGSNVLTVKEGKAYMTYADCPDKLCINQGKISLSGERIVCLPNKIMIEIEKTDR